MGADLTAPFDPNCSEGSVAKDGYTPRRVQTAPREWPVVEGHIEHGNRPMVPACPMCLRMHLIVAQLTAP